LDNSQAQPAAVAIIAKELRAVLRHGVRPARLREREGLLVLRAVIQRSDGSTNPDVLAFGLESVILEAIEALGDDDHGYAAQLLFGTRPGTRRQLLKERRRLAAEHLNILPSTFRRLREPDLVIDVAWEVLRIELRASKSFA
jgi:hypothetical protein